MFEPEEKFTFYPTILKANYKSSKQTQDKVKQDNILLQLQNKTATKDCIVNLWVLSTFQNISAAV